MSDQIGQIVDANANERNLAPKGVATQVALMSIISIVTILAFNILRPKNKIIYEPKVKYHVGAKPPPKISDSLFGWIPPLVHTREPVLVDKIGLDAVAFLRFLRMFRALFTSIAILTCAVLIPVNVIYTLKNVDPKNRDALSMLTIRDVRGQFLFAHIIVSYGIMVLVMGFIWVHWLKIVQLRRDWFRSPEYIESFYARTLTIMHVPKKLQSDEGIKAIFADVQVPYPTTSVHIGRKVGKLPELIEYHNTTVRELEQILVRYLKGGKIARERPTLRVGGFACLGGRKLDAIDFYTAKLKRTEAAIEVYRDQIDARKAENYGFASMASVPYAHIVGNMLRGKHPKGTDVDLAPNPKDIVWENMDATDAELWSKKLTGFFYLTLVGLFYTLPLALISILANLGALQTYVKFIGDWATVSPASFTIISGVLPSAVSGIFGFFLPIVVRWLSQYQGALTHSRLDRAVVGRYFAFLVVSQLVVFTLFGVIFQLIENLVQEAQHGESIAEIWRNLHSLPSNINKTYINQSSYWLTFFPLRGFLVFFDLAQIINLTWITFKTHMFGRTPRDIREWTKPADFEYAVYYTNILFMGTVAMVFAPLAPLVVVAAAVVFWISSWVYKYQLMFVFTTKVETGGRIWNVMVNRLLASVILMQLLMILTIGLQSNGGFKSFTWVSTVPPIPILLLFKAVLNKRFSRVFQYYIPTDEELRSAKIHSERADNKGNRLEKRFGHPALHADLFTPMLHAKMMPLLADVYKGKIEGDHAMLGEYGGQKMEAQVVEAGVKFAAVDQRDLEYDPTLYQRDRGELDWDQRSIGTTHILGGDGEVLHPAKSVFYAHQNGRGSPAIYDKYLTRGPGHHPSQSDIELSRMDPSSDHLPLLPSPYGQPNRSHGTPPMPPGITPGQYAQQQQGYFDGAQQYTQRPTPPNGLPRGTLQSPYPPQAGGYRGDGDGYREAPVHRPTGAYPPPPQPHSRQNSNWSGQQHGTTPSYSSQGHQRGYSQIQESSNMAGRGAGLRG